MKTGSSMDGPPPAFPNKKPKRARQDAFPPPTPPSARFLSTWGPTHHRVCRNASHVYSDCSWTGHLWPGFSGSLKGTFQIGLQSLKCKHPQDSCKPNTTSVSSGLPLRMHDWEGSCLQQESSSQGLAPVTHSCQTSAPMTSAQRATHSGSPAPMKCVSYSRLPASGTFLDLGTLSCHPPDLPATCLSPNPL